MTCCAGHSRASLIGHLPTGNLSKMSTVSRSLVMTWLKSIPCRSASRTHVDVLLARSQLTLRLGLISKELDGQPTPRKSLIAISLMMRRIGCANAKLIYLAFASLNYGL